jgi:hypothetical protein
MTVIDIVDADTVEDGDTIRYRGKRDGKAFEFTLTVKGEPNDTGNLIEVYGYSHDTGDNVTAKFRPDQRVELLGS